MDRKKERGHVAVEAVIILPIAVLSTLLLLYLALFLFQRVENFFAPLNKFSELYKSSENLGFQWRRETGEAPPVADKASLFRGRPPISGYKVSTDWLEPTVYPLLGYLRAKSRLAAVALRNAPAGAVPRTPFTRKGYAASVKRHSR